MVAAGVVVVAAAAYVAYEVAESIVGYVLVAVYAAVAVSGTALAVFLWRDSRQRRMPRRAAVDRLALPARVPLALEAPGDPLDGVVLGADEAARVFDGAARAFRR